MKVEKEKKFPYINVKAIIWRKRHDWDGGNGLSLIWGGIRDFLREISSFFGN